MRVLVTGATGVLGRRIVSRLAASGHEVHGLVRDAAGADAVRDEGGHPLEGDVLEPSSLADVPDAEVLVHAATAIPTERKPPESAWAYNDRVRQEGLSNVLDAVGGLEHVLFPSVVWVARQPDGQPFDEDAERHPDRPVETVADIEDELQAGAAAERYEATILRCGFFYAADAAHTRQFGQGVLSRRMPIIARGILGRQDAPLSFVHPGDAADAFVAAIDGRVAGCYHIVDDEPVSLAHFLRTLAEELQAPEPFRMPAWLARYVLGAASTRLLSRPMPTTNDRFREVTDWRPTYPTVEDGLEAVVERWIETGTLRETDDGYAWTGP